MSSLIVGAIGFPVGLVVGFGVLTQANAYEQHAAINAGDIGPLMRSCFVGAISGTICGAISGPISNRNFTPLRIENAHGTVTFLFENAPEWAFSKRKGVMILDLLVALAEES